MELKQDSTAQAHLTYPLRPTLGSDLSTDYRAKFSHCLDPMLEQLANEGGLDWGNLQKIERQCNDLQRWQLPRWATTATRWPRHLRHLLRRHTGEDRTPHTTTPPHHHTGAHRPHFTHLLPFSGRQSPCLPRQSIGQKTSLLQSLSEKGWIKSRTFPLQDKRKGGVPDRVSWTLQNVRWTYEGAPWIISPDKKLRGRLYRLKWWRGYSQG